MQRLSRKKSSADLRTPKNSPISTSWKIFWIDNGFNFTVFTLMPDFFKPNADFSISTKCREDSTERQSLETNLNLENLEKVLSRLCHTFLPTCYIVPKSSPFISEFKRAITDASEFGFVRLVTLKTNADIERKQAMRLIRKHGREAQVISLSHLENIFNFYKICIAVCSFIFLAEIRRHWVRQHLRTFHFLYFMMSNF